VGTASTPTPATLNSVAAAVGPATITPTTEQAVSSKDRISVDSIERKSRCSLLHHAFACADEINFIEQPITRQSALPF